MPQIRLSLVTLQIGCHGRLAPSKRNLVGIDDLSERQGIQNGLLMISPQITAPDMQRLLLLMNVFS